MQQLTVDDMKAIELDIMDEIDRVCQAHGVQYFLGYGSLLWQCATVGLSRGMMTWILS